MKYFKFKRLMKKRKAFANIEILFGAFLNKLADGDKKLLLTFMYNVNIFFTFVSILAPIFVYELIYYFRSDINPFYIATIYFFVMILITDINNDDYDPEEMENISQWMYRAQKNNFKLLIIEKLLFTFGTKILFYCFFIIIFMRELHFSYTTIFLYEFLVLITVLFTIILKFLWSNHQIIFLFIHGPNNTNKKEHIIKYRNDYQFDKYQIALSRSCQNRTYYLYMIYTYMFTVASLCIIWILNFYFNIDKFIIISVYLAAESAAISFVSQGIINSSKMLQDSNLSDFYYIKKFNQKNYYNNLLAKFLSRKLIVILISYYLGVFILYGLSLFTVITILCSTIIYYCSIKIITKRVYRFKKLSIEDIKSNFFIYFFNPIEDLLVLGLPFITCSVVAVYSMKLGNIYPIMGFFIVYSIYLLFYNFLTKER
ncbi:sugar transporter [[Bacillus thuringiensis] serovar konkukian]|nr:sugar transporter [Bacillus thuringiensis]MED1300569.1 sugar transporter [Bacillus pacificus]OUB15270.1 sugar transporter [[Bacillus thuringiensis] serovar konkukian]